jgi:hypothetical protein
MASWLADGGSGGAAEYVPADALAAAYVSMREPGQLFQEFTSLMAKQPGFADNALTQMEEKLGSGFVASLAGAMGTEAAIALNGFSVTGPSWIAVALANDPVAIDSSLAKLVETFNAELGPDEQEHRATLTEENANGRTWHRVTAGGLPFGVTWTYDAGYLVAASDRGTAERAIATRNSGSALVWSSAFQGQLPSSAGIHPSAFAWLNTKGALGMLSAVSANPAIGRLMAAHDPVLVVFDGRADQIHAASRTRLAGLIVDAMLLNGLGGTTAEPSAATARH